MNVHVYMCSGQRTTCAPLPCVIMLLVSMCLCVSLESELDTKISAEPHSHGPQGRAGAAFCVLAAAPHPPVVGGGWI